MRHSGRGGVRAGGGRPSLWQHQPTCTIRIPKQFEKILLEIAQNLDQCYEDILVIDLKSLKVERQSKKEQVNLLKLQVYKHSSGKVVKLKDLVQALQVFLES
jgi:hypothetical protein